MICHMHLACRFTVFILYIVQQDFTFLLPIAKPMAQIASKGRLTPEPMMGK